MYRIFFSTIIIITILLTLCVSIFTPPMHKSIFVYDSGYKIVEEQERKVETKNFPTQTNAAQKKKTNKASPGVRRVVQKAETQPSETKVVKKNETVKKAQTIKTNQPNQKTTNSTAKLTTLSQREETILWNKWRSNLQNQIMKDAELPIMPHGTVFKFSFDVDVYGRISNVQTWSETPAFTAYAIQYIAPVIRNYQGREILNFPRGSNRISTTFEGGWKISSTSKYSSPDDFKDTEKVIK